MVDRDAAPIAWKDGVLIAPQHLQRQDLFHQRSLHARLTALSPHSWGIGVLRLDEAAIRQGQVRVVELSAIFPDGLIADVRAGEPGAPAPRALGDAMAPTAERLDVALGVAELREGADNFAGDDARYQTRTRREVADLGGGRSRVDLEVCEPRLVVLLGDEARIPGILAIKIGEVIRGDDGAYAWSSSYVPPVLSLGAAPSLQAELRELLALAIARRRALVEVRREHDQGRAEFLGRDITHYLLLDALGTGIPRLRHLTLEASTRPLEAFLALLEFAGRLTSFATQVDPAGFPAFVYLDLRASFGELLRVIRSMLGVALRQSFVKIPLALRQEDGMWLGRLADEASRGCATYVLAIESSLPAAEVQAALPRLSKIASWSRITAHVKQATPGVRIEHLPRAPAELPQRPRHLYFAIHTADADWRSVIGERTIAVFFPEPFDPRRVRVELFGILGAAASHGAAAAESDGAAAAAGGPPGGER